MRQVRGDIYKVMIDITPITYQPNYRGFRGHVLNIIFKTFKGPFSFRHRISNGCGYHTLRALGINNVFRDEAS